MQVPSSPAMNPSSLLESGFWRWSFLLRRARPFLPQCVFEIAHETMDVDFAATAKVRNQVANELPRAVVGDVATPSHALDFDTPREQCIFALEQVRTRTAATEGDHGGMLEQQQPIIAPGANFSHGFFLQG